MSRGGQRPGAGRKKGSRDKAPRRPSAPPPVDSGAEKAFLEACGAFVRTGEPFRILRDFIESADASRRAWALDKILSYGVGLPAKRGEIVAEETADPRRALEEAGRLVDAFLAEKRAELGAPEPPPAMELPPAAPPCIPWNAHVHRFSRRIEGRPELRACSLEGCDLAMGPGDEPHRVLPAPPRPSLPPPDPEAV